MNCYVIFLEAESDELMFGKSHLTCTLGLVPYLADGHLQVDGSEQAV